MVYYFTSNVVEPAGFIYVGKDKYESEFAIQSFTDELRTLSNFHVDKLSSAHIYLRMQPGQTWDDLPQELVMDLAQLTKANSIEGNKKDNITVIYTPWANLKKDGSMDVGQVRRILVPNRENPIVNRLNKTKVEKKPDLKAEKDDMLKQLRAKDQAAMQIKRKEEQRQAQEWKEKKWQKDHAYDEMFTEENMASSSNQDRAADWEDDFM
ncbi:hypothetical protein ACHAPV_008319 [Trichoderma viride]